MNSSVNCCSGLAGLALCLGLATGCSVGPNYHPPKLAAPPTWSAPLAGGETNGQVAALTWWKDFNDPRLNSIVDRVVRSNLDLTLASARVREARAQYRIVAARLGPSVGASGSYARQKQSENQPIIGSLPLPDNIPFENNVYQAGFDAAWEIDVFGGTRRAAEAGKAEVAAAEFGLQHVWITLVSEAARDYVQLRGHQEQLAIARKNMTAQQEALAITRDRFKNGLTTDLDVQQAATLLATTRSEIPILEARIESSIHRLSILIGQPPGALRQELSPPSPVPVASSGVPVGLPSELLLRRPDIQKAERQLAAATARIGVATADLFPKFSLTGVAGFQSVSASDWFTQGSSYWSVGPTVQWRLFDSGRIRANIRLQDTRQEQALAAYEQTALNAFEEVENSLVAYAKEQERQRALEDAVRSSADSLHLANQLYTNGLASFLNVLDAERSLYRAEEALAHSRSVVTQDLIALYKALGGGWESRLAGEIAVAGDTRAGSRP
jgi:NodT family efflux transporter outer membrane factor (OMF) lipoprotein